MRPSVLLWDFGDTLVDERWMLRAPDGRPDWERAWREVMAELADDWNIGNVSTAAVTAALASRTDMTPHDVDIHARDCCRRIQFHPAAWQVAQDRRLPQALVTVNPDCFSEYVAQPHDLGAVFDEIVVSGTEHTADKTELCIRAIERLGFDGDRSQVLLIDNRQDLTRAWEHAGGSAYWFRSDADFAEDLPVLLDPVT